MNKITIIHPQAGVNWKDNSATFSVELARYLDNYFEVELLSGAECGSFSRPLKSITGNNVEGLNSHSLRDSILPPWLNHSQFAIAHLTSFLPCITYLSKNPPDLLLPQNGYLGLLLATCVRGIKGTPILFTEHHSLLHQGKYLKRNLGLKPNRLISLNPVATNSAIRLAPHQLVNTIPYGIDPTEFCPQGKAIRTSLSQPCIITVAPLNRDRNQRIELTIKAVSRLPQASLLICGDGKDKQYFQRLGDRLLGDQRFQIKTFAYAQMPQVYRSANLFTCAATQVSGGLKYMEAMACGLPVVATDDTIRRYLIGNGGITCDVTDLDLYTKSLAQMLDQDWSHQEPRQNALRFSWQGIALLYYKAILKTIAESNNNFAMLNSPLSTQK